MVNRLDFRQNPGDLEDVSPQEVDKYLKRHDGLLSNFFVLLLFFLSLNAFQ